MKPKNNFDNWDLNESSDFGTFLTFEDAHDTACNELSGIFDLEELEMELTDLSSDEE